MNQILFFRKGNHNAIKKNFFIILFAISTFFILVMMAYYIYEQYNKYIYNNTYKKILNNISITTLYENNNSNYDASRISTEQIYNTNSTSFTVIGIIEITSLGINYPIINEFSYELLKIAPCKIAGVNPNEIR